MSVAEALLNLRWFKPLVNLWPRRCATGEKIYLKKCDTKKMWPSIITHSLVPRRRINCSVNWILPNTGHGSKVGLYSYMSLWPLKSWGVVQKALRWNALVFLDAHAVLLTLSPFECSFYKKGFTIKLAVLMYDCNSQFSVFISEC